MLLKMRPLIIGLAALFAFGGCVFADGDIVLDDYVTEAELQTADEAYEEPEYDEGDGFSADAFYEENNDGDDTYISNDGTIFRIPRIADKTERVFDYAGEFTSSQQEALRARIAKLEAKKDCAVIILVSSAIPKDINNGSETTQKYLQQFYIDNNFRKDGAGFIIDLNNRVLWTVGSGKYRTQKFINFSEKVYNDCLNVAKRGDFYAAANTFLDDFDDYGNVLKAAVPTPLSLLVSLAAALLGILGFNIRHRSTQPSRATTPKLRVKGYQSTNHDERYLGTTVTRRHIPRSRDNNGGGGGGFSGGFSSGGFSSGGGSFSGGGGKF